MTRFMGIACFSPFFLALFLTACAPPLTGSGKMPAAMVEEKPAAETAPLSGAENTIAEPATPEPAPSAPPTASGTGIVEAEGRAGESAPPTEITATPAPSADGKEEELPPSAPGPPPEPGYMSAATYYATRFNGRPTITDEIYDPNKMTAATHELPLGTLARVINPKNGREVIVRINDRPRKRKFPLIDLSRAAAKKLGFLGKGKITVRVIPLPPDAPEYSSANKKKKKMK